MKGKGKTKTMLLGILTCKETLARLDDYLDRELSAREVALVERHLKICHECARRFAFERGLVEGLREKVARLEVPAELLERVREAAESAPSQTAMGLPGGAGLDLEDTERPANQDGRL